MGYGVLQLKEFDGYAHRFSYERFKGALSPGMHVCHRCDAPWCVNPDHLFLGTPSDNMRDCLAKGRHASQSDGTKYAKGESAAQAKLTASEVRKIRKLKGLLGDRKVARAYGVTRNVIRLIWHGKTWAHVR